MGRGWSYNFAAFVVFTISALLHELAVGIPTHNIIGEQNNKTDLTHACGPVIGC